jgi:cell division protein FtsA
VILVDIGGETTDVVIFVDGSVSYSAVVPIGGRHITSDLAVGLRVSLESAEKIKLSLNKPVKVPVTIDDKTETPKKKEDEVIDVRSLGINEDVKISRKAAVDGIIKPRLQEIFKYVGKEIKKSGFGTSTPSGLVICGGGAETVGVLDQAKYVLGFPARVGKIEGLSGLIDEIDSPAFASAAGLILYGSKESSQGDRKMPVFSKNLPIKGLVSKGIDFVKSFLP